MHGCAIAAMQDFRDRTYTHKAKDCNFDLNQEHLIGETTDKEQDHEQHALNVMPNTRSREGH